MSAAVLVVDDDAGMREALSDTLTVAGFATEQATNGKDALRILQSQPVGLIITDLQMPDLDGQALLEQVRERAPALPVLLMTGHGTVSGAVQAMRSGAMDFLTKPFETSALLERVNRYYRDSPGHTDCPVAVDPESRNVEVLARRVAASDVTVMITGESGTGKEVLARHIHACSKRSDRPFVAINCAAIPEQMLEAILFGYEKGAYTGAQRSTPGKFELADGGTLLLDEITEMDLALQAKLLRVLQEREVERLGGRETISLDIRVLATTNRDPMEEVARGTFREDLFYRLNVFALRVPPLRDRPGDLPALVARLLERAAASGGRPRPSVSEAALKLIQEHRWPGNVRELDNVLLRALVLSGGDYIGVEHLMFEPSSPELRLSGHDRESGCSAGAGDLKSLEFEAIASTLREVVGCRRSAAEKLGISERTLRYKLARMRDAGFAVPGDRIGSPGAQPG